MGTECGKSHVLRYHPDLAWKGLVNERWYYRASPMGSTRSYGLQKRDQRLEASDSASTLLLNPLLACVSCELSLNTSQWVKPIDPLLLICILNCLIFKLYYGFKLMHKVMMYFLHDYHAYMPLYFVLAHTPVWISLIHLLLVLPFHIDLSPSVTHCIQNKKRGNKRIRNSQSQSCFK